MGQFFGQTYAKHRSFSEKIMITFWLFYIALENDIFLYVSENSVPLNPMVNDHYPY